MGVSLKIENPQKTAVFLLVCLQRPPKRRYRKGVPTQTTDSYIVVVVVAVLVSHVDDCHISYGLILLIWVLAMEYQQVTLVTLRFTTTGNCNDHGTLP